MNLLGSYHQVYTYDTGNNLTNLLHQAKDNLIFYKWYYTCSKDG
ncbi:hypothetical protein BAZOLSSOX_1492 [uncultured Gammaproteobacteria bacterium]|nr:hypothetical protein BAZOLSSOX_1492 [uncultured Gammaproteobacteria bacterium]